MMTRAYSFLSGLYAQALGANAPPCKATMARMSVVYATYAPKGRGLAAVGLGGLLLAGCAQQSSGPGAGSAGVPEAQKPAPSRSVGVLLPLSGANAPLGRELLAGAEMALATQPQQGPPGVQLQVDAHDTEAPGGAAEAAAAAVRAGDSVLIGPLTSGDTAEATPAAQAGRVPVLALTSDVAQARPGVWVMGITPEDQVQRLVEQARQEGRKRFAALLPDNPLGRAMGSGLQVACRDQGLAEPVISYHSTAPDSVTDALKQLSGISTNGASLPAGVAGPGPDAQAQPLPTDLAAALGQAGNEAASTPATMPGGNASTGVAGLSASGQGVAPASLPFDALLLGDTGLPLKTVMTALNDMQVGLPAVRIMGPGLWAAFASKLGPIRGAWYAAPNPAARQGFVARFSAQYQHAPKPLVDLTYDAAGAIRTLANEGAKDFSPKLLTRPAGFQGVDGAFVLLPDGRVRRALAVFEVIGSGADARMIATAPTNVAPQAAPAAGAVKAPAGGA